MSREIIVRDRALPCGWFDRGPACLQAAPCGCTSMVRVIASRAGHARIRTGLVTGMRDEYSYCVSGRPAVAGAARRWRCAMSPTSGFLPSSSACSRRFGLACIAGALLCLAAQPQRLTPCAAGRCRRALTATPAGCSANSPPAPLAALSRRQRASGCSSFNILSDNVENAGRIADTINASGADVVYIIGSAAARCPLARHRRHLSLPHRLRHPDLDLRLDDAVETPDRGAGVVRPQRSARDRFAVVDDRRRRHGRSAFAAST